MGAVAFSPTGGKLEVSSPYLPSLPPRARALGGKWDAAKRVWVYDARNEQRVRELYNALFGASDEQLVTLLVPASETEDGSNVAVAGRVIARRCGRDYDVCLGEGVTLAAGEFERSGGSIKHPRVAARSAVIYQIRDVPLSLASAWVSETGRVWKGGAYRENEKAHPASRIL